MYTPLTPGTCKCCCFEDHPSITRLVTGVLSSPGLLHVGELVDLHLHRQAQDARILGLEGGSAQTSHPDSRTKVWSGPVHTMVRYICAGEDGDKSRQPT